LIGKASGLNIQICIINYLLQMKVARQEKLIFEAQLFITL